MNYNLFREFRLTSLFGFLSTSQNTVGVFIVEGPPVPIPNTVVKLNYAENTWLEAAREDRSAPTQLYDPIGLYERRLEKAVFFYAFKAHDIANTYKSLYFAPILHIAALCAADRHIYKGILLFFDGSIPFIF